MHDEIDDLLSRKFGDVAASLHLPEGCASRLKGRIRQRRRWARVKFVVVGVLAAVLAVALCTCGRMPAETSTDGKVRLIAGSGEAVPEVQTGWMFFSFFTECIRRIKTHKRKEEE